MTDEIEEPGEKLSEYFCIRCGDKIPVKRWARKANTCSDRCAKAIKKDRQQRREQKYCRLCNKPSSPEQRESFREWARERLSKQRGRPKIQKETTDAPSLPEVND